MSSFKRKLLLSLCSAATIAMTSQSAFAANWLMLQGTERDGQAPRAKVWGFIQPEFQSTSGTTVQAGAWNGSDAIFNQMRPDLKSHEGFNVLRARLGVRGTGMPLDSKVNYFLLAEFGNNGITRQGGGSAKVTDASVTLNHIPGARVRIGTFKTPGSEEGLQAIHVFDYINFTGATNGLLLERFFDGDGSTTFQNAGGNSGAGGDANRPNGPVGAFRDTGIQIFDTFGTDVEIAYALMYGNGNGITRGDNDDNKETYAYISTEWVYGGKGPRRQGLKIYAWNQSGKRTLTGARNTGGAGEYDRDRSGLGLTFKKGKHRAAFEYMVADGMIFTGTDGAATPGSASSAGGVGVVSSFNVATTGEADGYYAHYGYAINNEWELDARYDVYNRLTNSNNGERKFDTLTLGAQYFFNKKSRLILNYEFRNGEAPNSFAQQATANAVLDSLDDRLSLQFLAIF